MLIRDGIVMSDDDEREMFRKLERDLARMIWEAEQRRMQEDQRFRDRMKRDAQRDQEARQRRQNKRGGGGHRRRR